MAVASRNRLLDGMTAPIVPCSHPERLDEDYAGERPEYISEAGWPLLKQELILSRAGVLKLSDEQLASRHGVKLGQIRGLKAGHKWRPQFDETRQNMLESAMVLNEKVHTVLHEKWSDPAKLEKMSPLDAMKAAKLATDTMLNLSNGNSGGGISIGQINFADVKALVNMNVQKPGA